MREQEQHNRIESAPRIRESVERAPELKTQHERLSENHEASAQKIEQAATEAKKIAQSKERPAVQEKQKQVTAPHTTKMMRQNSYKHTMKTAQSQMSPTSRSFSKFIHSPKIEKTSEIIGATIARPDAILAGSLCAFIAVGSLYITAKFTGFSLSGFETIAAFIAGWLVGIVYDLIKSMISGRR